VPEATEALDPGIDEELPASLSAAVRTEARKAFHAPYEIPVVIAVNGALMSSCWVFLPGSLKDKIFTLHGTLAFALVLAAWMFSDVPATNVVGPDSHRVLLALGDRVMFGRLLLAKQIFLWILIVPLCAVVALFNGLIHHNLTSTVLTIVWIAVVPFGALGLSNLVGIRFPYHPMPLRFRWQHRKPFWRMIGRWLSLAVTPYVLVPVLCGLLMAPTLLLWGLLTPKGLSKQLQVHDFGWGVAVACVIAGVCWWAGQRIAFRLSNKRLAALMDFLSDPARG
jgi:hypothetical protein